VFRRIVGIPMGITCAPLIADLFYTAMNLNVWLNFTKKNLEAHTDQ